jgi:hypothetical protein
MSVSDQLFLNFALKPAILFFFCLFVVVVMVRDIGGKVTPVLGWESEGRRKKSLPTKLSDSHQNLYPYTNNCLDLPWLYLSNISKDLSCYT